MPPVTITFNPQTDQVQATPDPVSVSESDPMVIWETVPTSPPIAVSYLGFKKTVGFGTGMGIPNLINGQWTVTRNPNPTGFAQSFPYSVFVRVGTGETAVEHVLDPEVVNEPDTGAGGG